MAQEQAARPTGQPENPVRMPRPSGSPGAEPQGQADGTNVSMTLSALIGLGVTVAFYALVAYPAKKSSVGRHFGELWMDRTWVVYVTAFLTAWALAILFLKYRKLSRQREALRLDLIPSKFAGRIDTKCVDQIQGHIKSLPVKPGESFLVDRLTRVLDHFRSRGNVQEVANLTMAQGDLDAANVQSSYIMLNTLSWAVPILGFIGTVYGIGLAIGEFNTALGGAANIDTIKESLRGVTSGLAVAFDTTLLALILSLLIVFPAKGLQKAEEGLLSEVDDYCSEKLLSRLEDGARPQQAQQEQSKEWVQEAVAKAMVAQEAEFKSWTQHLQEAGQAVAQHVVAGWETVNGRLSEGHEKTLGQLQTVLAGLAKERQEFLGQVQAVQEDQIKRVASVVDALDGAAVKVGSRLADLQAKQAEQSQATVKSLSETAEKVQEQIAALQTAQLTAMKESVGAISSDLKTIQAQTSAAQAESSKHFEQLSNTVTQQVIEGWKKIDAQLRERTENEVTSFREVMKELADERKEFAQELKTVQASHLEMVGSSRNSLEGLVSRVQQEIAALQDKQVKDLKESVSSISGDLRQVREQTGQQHRAESEQLQRMVTAFAESLRGLKDQMGEMQRQVGENLRASGGAVREEFRSLGGELAESLRGQLQSLEQARRQGEDGAEKFAAHLERMRTAFSDTLSDAVDALRDGAKTIQQEMANGQENAMRKLQDVAGAMAEQARNLQREVDGSREALNAVSRELAQHAQRVRESTEQAARTQVDGLSQAADRLTRALSEQVGSLHEKFSGQETGRQQAAAEQLANIKREREAMERAAAEQLSKAAEIGRSAVSTIAESQKALTEQVRQLAELMKGVDKLGQMQQKLGENLQILASADAFRETLSGIDRGLNYLHPVLKDISQKSGIPLPDGTDGARQRGKVSRMWKRVTGG